VEPAVSARERIPGPDPAPTPEAWPLADASRTIAEALPRAVARLDADPESVEQGLARLVLTVIELLRQLMERQALRRVAEGSVTPEQEERLGLTFKRLGERMEELKREFGLEGEDLNLDLGPLGRLL
jgi:hypothetical protein